MFMFVRACERTIKPNKNKRFANKNANEFKTLNRSFHGAKYS